MRPAHHEDYVLQQPFDQISRKWLRPESLRSPATCRGGSLRVAGPEQPTLGKNTARGRSEYRISTVY